MTASRAYAQAAEPGNFFVAGKNKIINGDFFINQRNFTSNTAANSYNFDRWYQGNGGSSGTLTVTPQTFTPGAAPVAGYEARNFIQCVTASGASTNTFAQLIQKIEDVRTFANQTITVSFWAKTTSGTPKIALELEQNFGTGGSPSADVFTYAGQVTLSTNWTRYSITVAVPTISGKTIGTTANTSSLGINFWFSAGSTYNSRTGTLGLQNDTFQIWGVQAEAGSVATPFTTATGTLAGELAACQRYYQTYSRIGNAALGACWATDAAYAVANFFCQMRVAPTITLAATGTGSNQIRFLTSNGGNPGTVGTIAAQDITTDGFRIAGTGFTSAFTIGNCSVLFAGGSTATTIYTASAEL